MSDHGKTPAQANPSHDLASHVAPGQPRCSVYCGAAMRLVRDMLRQPRERVILRSSSIPS
jgi:hypothetical protein